MHGRGLATRLLEQLAEIAAARGITRFDAELAPDAPALRDAVVRLAALAEAVPALTGVELHPLQVTLGSAPQRQRAKTW